MRLISVFEEPGVPKFPVRWRGYDRALVDRCFREMEARQRQFSEALKHVDRLLARCREEEEETDNRIAEAQCEAAEILAVADRRARSLLREAEDQANRVMYDRVQANQHRLERLTVLRHELVGCLDQERSAPGNAHPARLSLTARPPVEVSLPGPLAAYAEHDGRGSVGGWALGVAALVLSVAGFVGVATGRVGNLRTPEAPVSHAVPPPDQTSRVDPPIPPGPTFRASVFPPTLPVSSPDGNAGLVLTVTAKRECWIRTIVDGGQTLERTLQTGDTIVLHAHDEASLRIGDAGAISLLINNQPTQAFGASGQAVTRLITRGNYHEFLEQQARLN